MTKRIRPPPPKPKEKAMRDALEAQARAFDKPGRARNAERWSARRGKVRAKPA